MLQGSIPSRPAYGVLEVRPGRSHLMVADAEGAQAILDLAASAPPGFFADAHIVYIPKRAGNTFVDGLKQLGPSQFYCGPTYEAAVPRLRRVLAGAHMGLVV